MNRRSVLRCTRAVLVPTAALMVPICGVAAEASAAGAKPAAGTVPANFYNLLGLVLVLFLLKVGLIAMQILFGVMRPDAIRDGRDRLNASPGRTAGGGVLTLLASGLFIILIQVLPDPIKGLLAVALVLWLAWLFVKGMTVVSCEVGERLQAAAGGLGIGSDVAAITCGAVLLALADLVPGIGWVLDLCLLFLAVGVGVTGVRRREAGKAARATPREAEIAGTTDESGND